MATLSVKLTHNEVNLLAALASDQLFRREFIDSKIPGNLPDPLELSVGKKLVERLRSIGDPGYAARVKLRKSSTAKA